MPSFRIDVTVCIGQERLSGSVSTYTGTQFFQVWATMATGTIVADDDKAFCIFRAQRHCFMFFFENVFSLSLSLSLLTPLFSAHPCLTSLNYVTTLMLRQGTSLSKLMTTTWGVLRSK